MDELATARATAQGDAAMPSLLSVVRSALTTTAPASGAWTLRSGPLWCAVRPPRHRLPAQGWKVHLSATPLNVAEVLARAVPVLVARECEFKFAADLATVRWLTSRGCTRSAAGKVVTAYPRDDAEFRALVAELDTATDGLTGPGILSDRRHRPDGIVHYRYGAFRSRLLLDDDGFYRPALIAADGTEAEDRRQPWFTLPAWVTPPFTDQVSTIPGRAAAALGAAAAAPGPVRLGGRYAVEQAIRHSTRGGVFRGTDERTGADVIIRQARAGIEVDPDGRDACDRLRTEAELIRTLSPTLAPRLLDVIDAPGQSFLIREPVTGPTLRQWVVLHRDTGGVPLGTGLSVARALIRLFRTLHQDGLVVVDVAPGNLVVESANSVRLIDLEHAQRAGEPGYPVGTPGYTPPEHRSPVDPDSHPQPVPIRPRADVFGLGGLLFLLATGVDPVLAPEDAPARSTMDRMRAWLTALGPLRPLTHRLAPVVLGMMRSAPASRWELSVALRQLSRQEQVSRRHPFAAAEQDRLIAHGVGHLVDRLDPTEARLWPDRRPARSSPSADPCAVQHGAAGVLGTLIRAAPYADDRAAARAAVGMTARWIVDRLPFEPRLLPGLHFGRSGTAWALHDAAALLDEPAFAEAGSELALRVPLDRPNPDVAHGVAGAGMAQLRLWQLTHDPRFIDRARRCADQLLSTVDRDGHRVCWPIPNGLRSVLAGKTYQGFAHGTAGIGMFLLSAGALTGDGRYTDLAYDAAESLVIDTELVAGGARWRVHPGGRQWADAGWCAGSAGIGGFLFRAWASAGVPRLLEVALAAARTAYESRFYAPASACHGLAGGGHFLLDLADTLDEPRYRAWATDLGGVLAARATHRLGRLVVPDESGTGIVADYSVGIAGTLEFLVRLRHGGPALWQIVPGPPRRDAAVRQ